MSQNTPATLPGLTALILAGGRSRRMGRDKARMQLAGSTLLARAEKLAQACGADEIVVLGRADHPWGKADRTPFAGPATAVAEWLAAHPGRGRLLVIPVDMPGLDRNTILPLIAAGGACYGSFFLPFTAERPATPPPAFERIRELLDHLGVARLPVPANLRDQLVNLNTPQDVAAFEKACFPAADPDGRQSEE